MDITNDIISFIFTEKQLSLPGLGLLTLAKSSARRSPSKTKIYGPKFTFELKDSEYNKAINERFYQFVANKHNKSVNRVEDEINKFSIKILNNLANFNSADIKNLGSFKRVDDKILFEFSPVFNELLQESYPDFPLLSIDRKPLKEEKGIVQSTIPNAEPPVHRPKKSSKTGWLFPLFVLTILSLGFVCLMYCLSSILPDDNNQDISSKQNSTTIDSQSTNFKNNQISISKDTTTVLNSQAQQENNSVQLEKPEDTTPFTDARPQNIGDSAQIEEQEEKIESNINLNNLEQISLDELIALGPELKTKYYKSCIIIVGSFKRKSNSVRMRKRLIRDNFIPYIEKYGKFYRTGVVFDCDEKPLFEFLEDLRHSIDKDSWVLKYK